MKRIILASASPRRRELLHQIGVKFEVMVSRGEEEYTSVLPEEIVKELALMKAENVERMLEAGNRAAGKKDEERGLRDTILIGADTIVVQDGKILGKPADEADAFRMLNRLQSRVHQVYTGVAILDFDTQRNKSIVKHAEKTEVYVHEMEEEEIRRYIATKEPMDKAGAYGIQGCFAAYIDRIEGDFYNVVGLPLSYLYHQLKAKAGWGK